MEKMEATIELEFETPEFVDLGSLSSFLLDLNSLYTKIVLVMDGKYDLLFEFHYRKPPAIIPDREKLYIISLSKQSPIKISLGSWVPKAIEALSRMIRDIYTLREFRERRRLENQERKIDMALRIVSELQPNLSETQRIAVTNEMLFEISKLTDSHREIKILKP